LCHNNQHFHFSVSKDKKYRIPHPVFCQISNGVGEHLTTINVVEWEVTRQSLVRVTTLLYLVFLLMCLHTIVSQNFWTPCDVHFEKQTSVDNKLSF